MATDRAESIKLQKNVCVYVVAIQKFEYCNT